MSNLDSRGEVPTSVLAIIFFIILIFGASVIFLESSNKGELEQTVICVGSEEKIRTPALLKVGTLYIHQSSGSVEAIPIRKYTFLSGSVIKAISMDGKEIISSSYTLFLEDKD